MAINYIGLDPKEQPTWFKDRVIFSGDTFFVGGVLGGYVAVTATYTALVTDYTIDCSGTFTVNLFTAVGNGGKMLNIKNSGTGLITLDADGFNAEVCPSVGTLEPGGLGWYQSLRFLKKVFKATNVVGFDIVELSPKGDSDRTAYNMAQLCYKLIGYKFSN